MAKSIHERVRAALEKKEAAERARVLRNERAKDARAYQKAIKAEQAEEAEYQREIEMWGDTAADFDMAHPENL